MAGDAQPVRNTVVFYLLLLLDNLGHLGMLELSKSRLENLFLDG